MDDYVIDGDLAFSSTSSALKFYREQYHKKKEWQGLTDEDIRKLSDDCAGVRDETEFIRAIEAKLKAKNG